MRVCSKCGLVKDWSAFSRHVRMKDGLQKRCKQCCSSIEHQRYLTNPGKFKDYQDSYRSSNIVRLRDYRASRYKNDPEKYIARVSNRRSKLMSVEGHHSNIDLKAILARQDYLCANPYCRANLRVVAKHVDHVVSISQGGSDWPSNLQYLCQPCNDSKSDRDWGQWLIWYSRKNINRG